MIKLFASIVGFFLTGSFALTANAQFVGDVFVEQPSITAQSGETVSFTYQVFTGTNPVGALDVALTYQSDELELVGIEPRSVFADLGGFYSEATATGTSVLLANTTSLSDPSGTVALFDATFSVLAPAGSTIRVLTANNSTLLSDRSSITNGAFDAEIVVSSTTAQKQSNDLSSSDGITVIDERSNLFERAQSLRREGVPFEMVGPGGIVERTLVLVDER